MTSNAAHQALVDKLKDGAAASEPANLATLAKAIADIEQSSDFDYETSITDSTIADAHVSTINSQGATEVTAITNARNALASTVAGLRQSLGKSPNRMMEADGISFGMSFNDPWQHSSRSMSNPVAQFWAYDETQDRLYGCSRQARNGNYHVNWQNINSPVFCYYDFSDRQWTTIYYNNANDRYPEDETAYVFHFPFLLAKSDDANDLKWCLVSFWRNPGDADFQKLRWRVFSEGTGQNGADEVLIRETDINTVDFPTHHVIYDTTNKKLIVDRINNSTSAYEVFWDQAVDVTLGSVFATQFATPTAQYLDIFQSVQVDRSRPANKGPIWDMNTQHSATDGFDDLHATIHYQKWPLTGTGNPWNFQTPIGNNPVYMQPSFMCSWMVRKADNSIEFRHGATSFTQKAWEFQSIGGGVTNSLWIRHPQDQHGFAIYDADFNIVKVGNLRIQNMLSNIVANSSYPHVNRLTPMFYHPVRNELMLDVSMVSEKPSNANMTRFTEIFRV